MTNVPVEEQLGFSIDDALSAIRTVDDALQQVVQSFSVGLSSALETLTSAGQDVTPIAESLDVAGLGPAIDSAIEEASATVPLEGDTSGLVSEIEEATDVTATVPVDADVSAAATEIDSLEGETVVVAVEADTAGAEADVQALGDAAGGAGGHVADLSAATSGFGAAAQIGRGQAAGLGAGIGLLGGKAGAVGAGFAAAAATVGVFFNQALVTEGALLRLDQTFGSLKGQIEQLKIGNLNEDLAELALSLGSDDDALRNIASSLFQFQTGAGTSNTEAVKFSKTVLALSARAVALNPTLGNVEDVANRLGNTFARGGRFLSQYQISLAAVDIKARAAENAQKGLGDGVSQAALQIAGAQLALERYGDTLTEDIARGTENPIIQLRALRVKFDEAAEAIGQPLVAPIFEILTAIEPVAESVGEVIGALAEVALPAIAAIGPVFVVLAEGLGLAADGITTIKGLLDDIPATTAALVVGLGVLTVAFASGATAAGLFAGALAFATGPIGLTIAALTLLAGVGVLGGFSDSAKEAEVDTTALAQAFASLSDETGEFTGTFDRVDTALDKFLSKQLLIGDIGDQPADALNALGLSASDLATILGSSDEAFNKFSRSLTSPDTEAITDETTDSFIALARVTRQVREALEIGSRATLQAAVDQGLLTRANVANSETWFEVSTGIGDNTENLRTLEPVIRAAQKAIVDSKLSTGELQQAFLDLKPAIADGSLTAADAQTVADNLGISLEDAEAAVSSLEAAMDSFVSTGLSALPDAGAAIQDFASGVSSAQSELDSALAAAAASDDSAAFEGVTRAQEEANQSLADNAEKTARTITEAQAKVDDARSDLAAAEQQTGNDRAAAIKSAQGKLESALDGLTKAQEDGGQSHADAVRDASRKVSAAQDEATQATTEEAQKAKEAQDAYLRAIDPQRVIDAQFRNAFVIGAFQENLTTLLRRGRENAVAALIAEGPEKGGQLANILVNDDTKARAYNDGIAVANQVTSGYGAFLDANKARLSGRLITLADGSVVDATDSFSAAGNQLGNVLLTGIATPIDASPEVKDAVRRLAEGGAAAFDPNLAAPSKDAAITAGQDAQEGFKEGFDPATTATTQVGKIPEAIRTAITPAVTASGIAGTGLTAEFADHLHFAGEVSANLANIPERFQRDDVALTAAGIAGVTLGLAFGAGFAAGIEARGTDVSAAAGALASTADEAVRRRLGIDSPSKAGIDIGNEYVAGIAQGLANLSPVEAATAALTLALVPDLRPVVRQTPQLASGIVAASPATVGAGASLNPTPDVSAPRLVEAQITLNKTDPDPKHFADELAWMLQ